MKSQSNYKPPLYVPLDQSDSEAEIVQSNEDVPIHRHVTDGSSSSSSSSPSTQWSSGICACCDDMQSCMLLSALLWPSFIRSSIFEGCVGLFCPCFLFGKNAEFLGSGTLIGSCTVHFALLALFNSICCVLTDGILLGLPGCFVACYACGYRRALRSKYNLQEAPCGDFVTHFFCHLCAICQEYREIRERSGDSGTPDLKLAVVTAPPVQTMESGLQE